MLEQYRQTENSLYAPSGEKLATIERMIDGVSIIPLTNALKEHFGASISVEANEEAS